jgi:tetratricopeptide (TPR) repeat protein
MKNWFHLAVISIGVLLLVLSCASKIPALYQEDGSPLSITDYEKIAQKNFDERRYDNAITAYTAIVSNYPDNSKALVWAYYEIGFCYLVKEDYDEAEFYFRIVINEYQDPAATLLAEKMIGKIIEEREKTEQRKERRKRKPPQEES